MGCRWIFVKCILCPFGFCRLEDRVNLLYTHGVCEGRLDLNTFVDVGSTQAAKLFGSYRAKAQSPFGSDADLVVYDPKYKGKISQKTQTINVDYSAFEAGKFKRAGRASSPSAAKSLSKTASSSARSAAANSSNASRRILTGLPVYLSERSEESLSLLYTDQ